MDTTDSFGNWVRRRRKALDLTQEELAKQVGCAAVTLRKIEAGDRRPSAQMARLLAQCLALPDEEHPAFLAAATGKMAPGRLLSPIEPKTRRPSGNLPASLTTLVGRTDEITALVDCLRRREARLLTLLGPVGVGKTRLALEVGRRLLREYRNGVCLVELAPLQDPGLVSSATASALGVRETRDSDLAQSVADFLANREMLLIFDNFEHLLPAAAFLSELLAASPGLHLLVTSRARLHINGEHGVVVSPLPVPERDDPLTAADTAAVQLFCDRARSARSSFQLTPSLTPVVADICRRLDGLPLAIELAAARLKLLSLQELHERLERRLPLLSQNAADLPRGRQGLHEAIAWSYGLLSPDERTLLARLSVFVGGFSLPAAELTCAFAGDDQSLPTNGTAALTQAKVASVVDALLDQSLLERRSAEAAACFTVNGCCGRCALRTLREIAEAESRFALLEIIREFALAQLQASGELELMQRRHAEYFADWAERAAAHLHGPDQAAWLARFEQEADNLRAALTTLLAAGPLTTTAAMACALAAFWQRHGHYSEGRRWLEQVLAQMVHTPAPDTLRARTLQAAAVLAYHQGDWTTAQRWLVESLALYQTTADQSGIARVLFDLGSIALDHAQWAKAARLNLESLTLARAGDDPWAIYRALTNLGWARLCVGAWESAAALFDDACDLAWRGGHVKGIAVSLANLGWIALHQGDAASAASRARNSLHLCHLLGEREVMAECLEILAAAAVIEGNTCRAAELSAEATSLWEALGVIRPFVQQLAMAPGQATRPTPRRTVGETSQPTWRHGRSLNPDAMIAFALECGGEPCRAQRLVLPSDLPISARSESEKDSLPPVILAKGDVASNRIGSKPVRFLRDGSLASLSPESLRQH